MNSIYHSLESIYKILRKNKPTKIVLVSSKTVIKKLSWAIKELKISEKNIILLPDGEKAKEWAVLEDLLKKFYALHIDRHSLVIALGGGTIGDVVGFAASIYLRGIPYMQIPTTLLAQVDSAYGGKTGINFLGTKNQIGSIYLSIATIIDTRFLISLKKDQIIDGLGEIIKAGLIKDPSILSLLKKENLTSLKKSKNLEKIIDRAIKVKQFYVEHDPHDTGLRQILNAGHTLGHSIELKYKISHGKAVIIGLMHELRLCEHLGLTPKQIRQDFNDLLNHLGIDLSNEIQNMRADWQAVLHDKKITGKDFLLPVIEKPGQSKLVKVKLDSIKKFI